MTNKLSPTAFAPRASTSPGNFSLPLARLSILVGPEASRIFVLHALPRINPCASIRQARRAAQREFDGPLPPPARRPREREPQRGLAEPGNALPPKR